MEHFARWVVRHRKAVLAAAVLLLVFAYLVVVGYGIYSRIKLEKEM